MNNQRYNNTSYEHTEIWGFSGIPSNGVVEFLHIFLVDHETTNALFYSSLAAQRDLDSMACKSIWVAAPFFIALRHTASSLDQGYFSWIRIGH